MRNLLIILIGTLIFSMAGHAQATDSDGMIFRNRVYAEILGVSNTFISFNYERVVIASKNEKIELTVRTGLGYSYFKNYNSHLYSVPLELNGLFGGKFFKLDVGLGYVKQYRTEITEGIGDDGIFNSGKGSFYHYSVRVGGRLNGPNWFMRASIGRNLTPKKLKRNYYGDETSSSKLMVEGLFGISFGMCF